MIIYPLQITVSDGVVGEYSFGICNRDLPDLPWELNDIVENTWYSISPPSVDSVDLNDVTHDGFGKLTVTKTESYYISWVLALPYEGGLDKGQFDGERLENCVETAVKVDGELITQNQDDWSLNEVVSNWCIVNIDAGDIVDINIRSITPPISTIIMDLMYLEVIEIIPGLEHHFPSVFI